MFYSVKKKWNDSLRDFENLSAVQVLEINRETCNWPWGIHCKKGQGNFIAPPGSIFMSKAKGQKQLWGFHYTW